MNVITRLEFKLISFDVTVQPVSRYTTVNFPITSSNWTLMPWKRPKTFEGERAVDHSPVSRWLNKFCSGCQDFNDQARSGKPKTMDYQRGKSNEQHWEGIRRASASHCRVWFITFSTLAKVFEATQLCRTLWKYCKTGI